MVNSAVETGDTPNFKKRLITAGIVSCSEHVRSSLLSKNDNKFKPLHISTINESLVRWKKEIKAHASCDKEQGTSNVVQQVKEAGNGEVDKAEVTRMEPSVVLGIPSTKGELLTKKIQDI